MPAHIGFLTKLKLPLAFAVYNATHPGPRGTLHGRVSMADLQRRAATTAHGRERLATDHATYRQYVDAFDPMMPALAPHLAAHIQKLPAAEWNLYFQLGCAHDNFMAGLFQLNPNGGAMLIRRKSNTAALKRVEFSADRATQWVTVWSHDA